MRCSFVLIEQIIMNRWPHPEGTRFFDFRPCLWAELVIIFLIGLLVQKMPHL